MTDLPSPSAAKPKNGKGLRIALAVSVALNLAVAGIVAGALLRDGPRGRYIRELDFGPYSEAFSPIDRAAMRDAFLSRDVNMRDMRDQMRSEGAALVALLRAETLDLTKLTALMQAQQGRLLDRINLGRELVAERIAAMSAQERRNFADRLERAFQHPMRGRD
jgi:uncharacterized membrane protein